ncbi:MAG: TPM domain-containing protein [Bacillota bacterium]|nr:TPM domain-containing protein [Bacillota bacterium]
MTRLFRARIAVVVVLVLLALALPAAAFPALAATAPTLPEPKGWVNDFAGVLKPEEVSKLDSIIQSLEKETTAEIAVVTVKTTQPLDPKSYVVALMEKWKVGKKDKDNGLILLVSLDDRRVEVEVGYGLEGTLPDSLVLRVIDNDLIPQFKQNKYAEGIIAAVENYAGIIRKAASQAPGTTTPQLPTPQPSKPSTPGFSGIGMVLGIGFVLLGLVIAVSGLLKGYNKCPVCKKGRCTVMDKLLVPATALAAGVGVRRCVCPACGYAKETEYRIPPVIMRGPRGGFGGFGGGGHSGGGGFGGFGGGRSGGGGGGRSW